MRRTAMVAAAVLGGALLAGAAVRGTPSPRGFVFEEIQAQGREYRYAVYAPRDNAQDQAWPLIVFLHGRGECGTDGQRQLAVGLGPRVLWNPEQYPAVILFPQKPDGDSEWEDHLEALKAMMDATRASYRIDDDRVSLTGLSQGGHGTWAVNAEMPGTFAAIAPLCGYVEAPEAGTDGRRRWPLDRDGEAFARIVAAAAKVPVWAFHGEADDVVPAEQSEAVVAALQEIGADARLTTYPDVGHNCWDRAYGSEGLGAWLLVHRRRSE